MDLILHALVLYSSRLEIPVFRVDKPGNDGRLRKSEADRLTGYGIRQQVRVSCLLTNLCDLTQEEFYHTRKTGKTGHAMPLFTGGGLPVTMLRFYFLWKLKSIRSLAWVAAGLDIRRAAKGLFF